MCINTRAKRENESRSLNKKSPLGMSFIIAEKRKGLSSGMARLGLKEYNTYTQLYYIVKRVGYANNTPTQVSLATMSTRILYRSHIVEGKRVEKGVKRQG